MCASILSLQPVNLHIYLHLVAFIHFKRHIFAPGAAPAFVLEGTS